MSKKRKTRKQKELAHLRHNEQLQHVHIHTQEPTYSISDIKPTESKSTISTDIKAKDLVTIEQKDAAYLKHDMVAITAASGIVAAFDILLFVLLTTGVIHLNFLGY
jgi:hypothetical protein